MITWHEVREELLKDPNVKREYDALMREESAEQEALDRAEEEQRRRASTPPVTPRPAYA
ncbi:XRE family transcriptional regulator [Selenomonas sp. oral taxon 126]|uniref:XRE family transcriptional regulator n=1 Tax=Selenomonas sp. oral taxon 126 TaxID=712528 RepID=UPI001C12B541|nr:XRE family transcriptional regulator [Selenomonas sp. oral taxon 126]